MPYSPFPERRRSPRRRARREVQVTACPSVLDASAAVGGGEARLIFFGDTADISATGIAFAVPHLRVDEQYLASGGRRMGVVLSLPSAPVEMRVRPVRCEPLDAGRPEAGSLIGADIAEVDEGGRHLLDDYLRRT